MEGEVLRNDQWERLREFVPGGRKGKRGPRSDGRLFLDALLWLARSGSRWRDLPARFGPYQTAKRRYYRWVAVGVIDRIFEAVSDDPDIEWLAIAYKQRWGIEGFFAKLKQWRRIATRYDKLARNFLGFVKLASIMLWIK